MIYKVCALENVTRMSPGSKPWNRYQNDLWHWFKHARGIKSGKVRIPAEMSDVPSEGEYLRRAKEICRKAAMGFPGTEVRVREYIKADMFGLHYLIWYQPPGAGRGLFLIVKDRGSHGELVTMFPPLDGRSYFERQTADSLH